MDDHIFKILDAMGSIKQRHGKPKESITDSMRCPACGGELHYSVSSYNGHTSGSCKTDSCLQ